MNIEKRILSKPLMAEMIIASALMDTKERFDSEDPNYIRGFLEGYYHCLKLATELDTINNIDKLQ